MYTIKLDPHTHTLSSIHAFGTIGENARCARERGMEAIAMSDHFGRDYISQHDGRPDFTTMFNMPALPDTIEGVRVLASAEIDIVDGAGRLYGHDIPFCFDPSITTLDWLLRTRDAAIASYHHFDGANQGTVARNTDMYIRAITTPGVHIIGHPARAGLPFDVDALLAAARDAGKMIEVNEHSLHFGDEVRKACARVAERCAELGVYVAVGSDAHSPYCVGALDGARAMLASIGFPQELIANETPQKFLDVVRRANERDGFAPRK